LLIIIVLEIDYNTLYYKAEIFLSTFKKINEILINMNLNKQIKEFLIGTLLGDAHIGRTGLNKAFISFEQSTKKREYLNYLLNITKEGEIPLMDDNIREYLRDCVATKI